MMMFIQDVFFTKQLLTAVKFNNDDVYTMYDVYSTRCVYSLQINC